MGDRTPPAGVRAQGFISRLLAKLAWNPQGKPRGGDSPAYTPESLANVLVRQFETAFLVIPTAAYGAGKEPALLLRKTADVLRGEGGFVTRIGFLILFADVIEQQSSESLLAFCDFVTGTEALRATFGAEEKGRDAFEALRGIWELSRRLDGALISGRDSERTSGARQVRGTRHLEVQESRLDEGSMPVEVTGQVHESIQFDVTRRVELSGHLEAAKQVEPAGDGEKGKQTGEPLPVELPGQAELRGQTEEALQGHVAEEVNEAELAEGPRPVESTGQVEPSGHLEAAKQVEADGDGDKGEQTGEPLPVETPGQAELGGQTEEAGQGNAAEEVNEAERAEGTLPIAESTGQVELSRAAAARQVETAGESERAKQTEDLPLAEPPGRVELSGRTAEALPADPADQVEEVRLQKKSGPVEIIGPVHNSDHVVVNIQVELSHVEDAKQVETVGDGEKAEQTVKSLPVEPPKQVELSATIGNARLVEAARETGETTQAEWAILRDAVRRSAVQITANQRVRTITDAFVKAPHLSFLRRPLEELAMRAAHSEDAPEEHALSEQKAPDGAARPSLDQPSEPRTGTIHESKVGQPTKRKSQPSRKKKGGPKSLKSKSRRSAKNKGRHPG